MNSFDFILALQFMKTDYDNMPLILVVFIFSTVFFQIHANDDLIVQLPKGKIRGHILKSENDKPYYAFQEIPYAAPPIGTNRFALPKEPEAWNETLDATKNKVICYQAWIRHENLSMSEDCLFINVYTPVAPGSRKLLPVLLWVHGGGFTGESAAFPYFGPKYLMDSEVVVVTFNYRLGPFGFLTTFDDVIPGNLGFRDQVLAMEWVHENIGLFGGNKSHVTLTGESAGAMAIGSHLLGPWPENKTLYHAAISQSGSRLYFPKSVFTREEVFSIGHMLDGNFSSKDSKDLLKLLQEAPAEDIQKAQLPGLEFQWGPVVERDGIFGQNMYDCLTSGNFKKMPILLGFTSEEWLQWTVVNKNLTAHLDDLDKNPAKIIRHYNIPEENRTKVGNLLRGIYTNSNFSNDIGAFIRFESDTFMTTPIMKQAIKQSKFVDVYMYQFAYKGELGMLTHLPSIQGCERVSHAEDLKYMWDDGSNSDLSKFPADDGDMLHRNIKLLTNFVKFHNPTPTKDPLLQNIIWPKVNPDHPENIQYLNMNKTFEIRSNPRNFQNVIKLLDEYIKYE